jgi:HD superfamily phosphohydrolase
MKIIRDSIHGDIALTREEMRLLHTPQFQRLHTCRQLGLTHLVYPAAKHARFEHVLGVMHLADKIAASLKQQRAFFKDGPQGPLWKTLRFAALLHDMGHVPFGHTLEDEMPVISKHDAPSDGQSRSRMDELVTETLTQSGNAEFITPVLQTLLAINESKNDEKIYALVAEKRIAPDLLVVADIIGNTICADLLDYIRRDHLMTGIRATYDDRIFKYFGVDEHEFRGTPHKRLIIRLVKNGRIRGDCLADLLDILKLRYNLSDKVLFHPKKCAADTMLIRAVLDLNLGAKDLLHHSDDGFFDTFKSSHPLIEMLASRSLYKPVLVSRMEHLNSFDARKTKVQLVAEIHKDAALRKRIELTVEKRLGLSGTSPAVLIYCPHPKMTLKSIRVLVQWRDGTIRRLNAISEEDDRLTHDQVSLLEKIYPSLWRLYVFVPQDLRSAGRRIREVFVDVLKEETGLDITCDPAYANYLEKGCPDYAVGARLDSELTGFPAYQNLTEDVKLVAWRSCHEKLRIEEENEDYDEADVSAVAARTVDPALLARVREIIRTKVAALSGRRGNSQALPLK